MVIKWSKSAVNQLLDILEYLDNNEQFDYSIKIEKEILMNALNLTHWNRTLAAKKLGMSFRSLRYRLKKFGLDGEDDSV